MAYAPKEPFRSREFWNWNGVFAGVSLPAFNVFAPYLSFPFSVSEPVHQIGRDFAIAGIRAYGVMPPFEPIEDLLRGVPEELPYVDKGKSIFAPTFSRLKELGYADKTYAWGNTTQLTYPPAHVEALLNWHWLLVHWLILELKRDDTLFDKDVVRRFMEYGARASVRAIPYAPALAEPTKTALQAAILNYDNAHREFTALVERLRATSDDAWQTYLLNHFAHDHWLANEGFFRLVLEEWRTIERLLSASERVILEEWAQQMKRDRYPRLIIPMPIF